MDENKSVTIIKQDDLFYLVNADGTMSEPLTLSKDGNWYILPKNDANRQYIAKAKADKIEDSLVLEYRATRTVGVSTRVPNAKIIEYLSEDEQAEYKALVDKAVEAMKAEKSKPLTEVEKLQAKIAKAQEALAKLTNIVEEN